MLVRSVTLACALGVLACRDAPQPSEERGPNVLLVTIETLRADHVGSYGYYRNTTPNLDRLAAQGARFDNVVAQAPFTLPETWLTKESALDPATPYNFTCTADIIGGNSGSPVVNRAGEVVGLIFDGNLHSLVYNFAYTDEVARSVAVDSRGIVEALEKVYDAKELVGELQGEMPQR